jgi:hypothetical protein
LYACAEEEMEAIEVTTIEARAKEARETEIFFIFDRGERDKGFFFPLSMYLL